MTREILFPYGKGNLGYEFDSKELSGVLTSSIEEYIPEFDETTLVKKALEVKQTVAANAVANHPFLECMQTHRIWFHREAQTFELYPYLHPLHEFLFPQKLFSQLL